MREFGEHFRAIKNWPGSLYLAYHNANYDFYDQVSIKSLAHNTKKSCETERSLTV